MTAKKKTTEKKPTSLSEAITCVMSKVGYVDKAGEVTSGFRFRYAGEAQFIAALRPWMVEYGLSMHCSAMTPLVNEMVDTKKGPKLLQCFSFCYELTWAGGAESRQIVALGQAIGTDDKGVYKAMTGAYKYAMRQTFMIETGDDPDKYQELEDFSAGPRAAAASKAKVEAKEKKQRQQELGKFKSEAAKLQRTKISFSVSEFYPELELTRDNIDEKMDAEKWQAYLSYLSTCITKSENARLWALINQCVRKDLGDNQDDAAKFSEQYHDVALRHIGMDGTLTFKRLTRDKVDQLGNSLNGHLNGEQIPEMAPF